MNSALKSISADRLLGHIRTLSSDQFEGRAPGTRGEELSVAYITEQFKTLGLAPGNPNGTYVQEVPLAGIRGKPRALFAKGNERLEPRFPDDYVAATRRFTPEVDVVDSDVVFVGYGIVAPEYGWDDYKGVDVRGKTIVMLINDPPMPDPNDPSKLDEHAFKGKAMTYYGRWTYKYEIATEKGAAAAVIVHETEPAGYPYEVVRTSFGQENFDIQNPDGNADRVAVEAWVSSQTAVRLFTLSGQDFAELKRRAISRDFQPVDLGIKANFAIRNTLREIKSRNILAKIEGVDPELKDELVIYTAHWDHLGKDDKLPGDKPGDKIYSGASDNASGVAGVLELARAFKNLPVTSKRTILFMSITAEEKGLLGSKYYAAHPLYPLQKTLAVINMDGLNAWGRARDIASIGLGQSTLDEVLAVAALEQGRTVIPHPEPEKGYFFRSDHFEFSKQGVPAVYSGWGIDFYGRPPGWGLQKRKEYYANDYHKVTDKIKPDWDLSGAVEDLRLLFEIGRRVAQSETRPEWKPGSEFKARRETSLRGG